MHKPTNSVTKNKLFKATNGKNTQKKGFLWQND